MPDPLRPNANVSAKHSHHAYFKTFTTKIVEMQHFCHLQEHFKSTLYQASMAFINFIN